jgi:hypothetical protein
VVQSKAKKTSKRAAGTKTQASHLKVPNAIRKPANQLLASLTGVMGKELLAEALVTIAGALVGARYVRSQSASSGDDTAPLSASEAIGRVLGTSLTDSGQKKKRGTRTGSQKRTKNQGTSSE